jgi:uncharacterized hydrophobic protein (TIGR00341 family)
MAQRLVKVLLPAERAGDLVEELGSSDISGFWQEERDDGQSVVSVLCSSEQVEELIAGLNSRFSGVEGFRLIVLPVEASLPVPEKKVRGGGGLISTEEEAEPKTPSPRISREELYSDVSDGAVLSMPYLVLVCLSTVVAAIGLVRDSVAVVIGAMVIAPLLGPNVGLSLSTTLADSDLGRKALRTLAAAVAASLLLSAALGVLLQPDPSTGEIASRTEISLYDIVLALAAGAAGVMALTSGAASAVIGVMVAVALLPPLVAGGLLLGSGGWAPGGSALLLFVCNVVSINLAGVLTFLLRGIRPMTWWEEGRARRSTRTAILFWTLLLAVLVATVLLAN